jgi:adenosylcobinamide kinase/adenosylcobinamide-phosphate guanylyltransferase
VSADGAFHRTLVLGGARSGKSRLAEQLVATYGAPVLYVSTAQAGDDEMAQRIARHRAARPATWRTLEAPIDTARAAANQLGEARSVLVEDLTILLSNLLSRDVTTDEVDPTVVERAEVEAVAEMEALLSLSAHVVLVSNEVGMGIVPAFPLGRAFRDALGRLNQHAAAQAAEVFLLVAGLPLRLKPSQVP